MSIQVSAGASGASQLEVYWGDRLLRKSGDKPTGNPLVDRVFENLVRIDAFTRRELGRKGWDDKDGPLRAQLVTGLGMNATFDVTNATILLGQRNGGSLAQASYGWSPTVMGHEVGHGMQLLITGRNWAVTPELSGVQESWADVLGIGADDTDWVLGDEVPGGKPEPGLDLRDLSQPPYKRLQDIPAGQSIDYSPLLSYAAVLVAGDIGKAAMRKLWFEGMKRMPKEPGELAMRVFADVLARTAAELHGTGSAAKNAVISAFKATGIL